jgi:hypothetical protein
LRRAFDCRDQPDTLFEPAFLHAQRSVHEILPGGVSWWRRIDPDWLAEEKATTCIVSLRSYREDLAFLRSYREDLRFAEFSLDATRGRETDDGEFDSTLADAERQTQAITRCISDLED